MLPIVQLPTPNSSAGVIVVLFSVKQVTIAVNFQIEGDTKEGRFSAG